MIKLKKLKMIQAEMCSWCWNVIEKWEKWYSYDTFFICKECKSNDNKN